MALGTTNINLRGDVSGNNGLYKEMGKSLDGNNFSLGQSKYGVNDIDIDVYSTSNPAQVKMSYWQNYDSMDLRFRFNTAITNTNDTYDDEDPIHFGDDAAGIDFTATGAFGGNDYWTFDGTNDYGQFEDVAAGDAYKLGTTGNMVIAFWCRPNYRGGPSGNTDILGTNNPIGTISQYRGYRFILQTDMQVRIQRGDGDGTGSQDRRTFETSTALVEGEWNFIAWQGAYNNQTMNTSNNYAWVWNATNGWQNGATFLGGSGGNLAYNATDPMTLSNHASGGRYYNGDIGGIWCFNGTVGTTDIETLKDNTNIF